MTVRTNGNLQTTQLGVQVLEKRDVPAGIVYDPIARSLSLTGDPGNDFAVVRPATNAVLANGSISQVADPSTLEASVQTSTGFSLTLRFATSSVDRVSFNGKGGADVFTNATTKPSTVSTTSTGTVSQSVLPGSPGNNNANDLNRVGVFVAGDTGRVEVDYLYCGAGYKGQLGFYSLEGMDAYAVGSQDYIREASRRILSSSLEGHLVINRLTEKARYGAVLPWEGNMNTGGIYVGPRVVQFSPGQKFAAMLVPSGTVSQVFSNPGATGSLRPLFSIPAANPYTVTSQLQGQIGDLTGAGSVFAFEDLRLDGSSDRDYNDMVFQVVGARGTATMVNEVKAANRDFTGTPVGKELTTYTANRASTDVSVTGVYSGGKYQVGSSGRVGIEYLFDSGGYVSQMGVFSLSGMNIYTPGSPEFIAEASRRILSNSTLGGLAIDDANDGARYTTSTPLMKSFNQGDYRGIKTLQLTPGDTVAFMLVPNGTVWEVFSGQSDQAAKRPLFSMPEANPKTPFGQSHFGSADGVGTVLAFEDTRMDTIGAKSSDRDFNDVVFRGYGLSALGVTPDVASLAAQGRDWTKSDLGTTIRVDSVQTF